MRPSPCGEIHEPRKLALTGGPRAGKTAVLELIRQCCEHVMVLPEVTVESINAGTSLASAEKRESVV